MVTNKLKPRHPLKLDDGKLPHELRQEEFLAWMIEHGMVHEDYELTLKSVDNYMTQITEYGYPVPTEKLTSDQAGWARSDHKMHYDNPFAKWFIDPEKKSRPFPAQYGLRRTREIREACDCEDEGLSDYAEWGTLYDGRPLLQCEECGEVIVRPKVNSNDVAA